MDNISPLSKIKTKKGFNKSLKNVLARLGGIFEILALLFIWALIFTKKSNLGGMTIRAMAAYILIGNLISLATSFMLERIFAYAIAENDDKLFLYSPLKYCTHILVKGFAKFIFPFLSLAAVDLALLYFFVGKLKLNLSPDYFALIGLMIIFAFIIEFFIAYLLYFFVFWTIESKESYSFALRLKKILGGNYFPLSFLPTVFLQISLFFPFAYTFFVPTQLFLKKISFSQGLAGIFIQLFWIFALYAIIRLAWNFKIRKNKRFYAK